VDVCGEAAAQQGCDYIQWSDYSNTRGVGWGCLCCDVESGESLQGRPNTYYSLYDASCYGTTPAPKACGPVLKHPESKCGKGGKNLGGAGTDFNSVVECAEAAGQQQGCGHIQWSEYSNIQYPGVVDLSLSNPRGLGWGCLCCDVESGEPLQGPANTYYSLYDVTCYQPTDEPTPAPIACAAVLKLSEEECPEGRKGKNLGGAGTTFNSVDECGEAAAQQGCDYIQWSDYSNTNGEGWGCLCCDVKSVLTSVCDLHGCQTKEALHPIGRRNTYYSLYDASCYGSGGESSGNGGKPASLAIIIPVVVAAVLLLAAVLFVVRKRVVAARQHRRESMPFGYTGATVPEAEADEA
jgi:hypothetical protein